MIKVSILIPTFRRPESFLRAARSVFAQTGVDGVELIAIDNSPEGSTLDTFRALQAVAPIPLRWAHEPKPGVAQARNAALKLAQGALVAWLDDDEEAAPHWLAALIAARRETGAQSVFGPVRAQAPDDADNAAFYERLYARSGPAVSGPTPRAWHRQLIAAARHVRGHAVRCTRRSAWRGTTRCSPPGPKRARPSPRAADAAVTEHLAERIRLAHGLTRLRLRTGSVRVGVGSAATMAR
ncbi:MAG: glycosyltransferase family 2 protein [Hyphomonadaceae bacterium]